MTDNEARIRARILSRREGYIRPLTNLVHAKLGATIASFAYGYNSVGSRTNALREDARKEVYGYDAIQQLTSVDLIAGSRIRVIIRGGACHERPR